MGDQPDAATRQNGGRPVAAKTTALRLAAAVLRTLEHRWRPRGLGLGMATAPCCATPIAGASRCLTVAPAYGATILNSDERYVHW